MKTTIALLILCGSGAILGSLAFFIYFGAALSQERDTSDIFKAAIEMEWNRRDSALVNSNPNRLLIRAGSQGLNTHLGQQGWFQTDRVGALISYRKGNQKLNANCGMFSRRYLICDTQVRKP